MAHNNLGNALKGLGRLDEAVASCHKALAIKPDYAEAHGNLGVVLQDLGKPDEAAASYRRALAIKPDYAEAANNLGVVLRRLGQLDEAAASYRKALAFKPDYAEAHGNLGVVLQDLGKLDGALASYRKALAFKPDFAAVHNNLGAMLRRLGKLDEPLASHHKALAIEPDFAAAHGHLGVALQNLGRLDEALASYRKALAIEPDYAVAHNNLGNLQLLTGDFRDGWENYAWRWQVTESPSRRRDYREPFWDGSALDGKTIFLYPEQGLGDTIQFARYLPLVQALGARVVLEVPKTLYRLFKGGKFAQSVVKTKPTTFDCHAPLLDLPRLLRTTLETIPRCDGFLQPLPELQEEWAARIRPSRNIRLGIAWAGNPEHRNDRNRSIEASLFRPLTKILGVSVYSLQVGRDGEAARIFDDTVTDLAPNLSDFADTAAVMRNLDLIVSADTAVAHLAGTLGKPVWTLLPFDPDWRWLLERDDSPWYPTMRLFRQGAIGDWTDVIEDIGQALHDQRPLV